MKTITGTTDAWLASHQGPEVLAQPDESTARKLFYSSSDATVHGWTLVGKATITVEIPEPDQLIANKVASLRKEIMQTRAEAEMKARNLEEKVQQLLAITYEVQE